MARVGSIGPSAIGGPMARDVAKRGDAPAIHHAGTGPRCDDVGSMPALREGPAGMRARRAAKG
ncbi:MAG: hypothetical protein FJX69_11935 [Alphaproteobacteria bacterium]|nr:hypothetical protein [Alphaproteobacteria bacterium]MBM3627698.1 hypothetical protein [Alphaproteobacteria bacterium]